MAWLNPTAPNLTDFFTSIYQNGVPQSSAALPSVSVDSGGSGYTTPPDVVFSPPQYGLTMGGTATVSGGAVTAITVDDPGTNYASPPAITIATATTQATATVTSLGSPWPASSLNGALQRTINPGMASSPLRGELTDYVQAVYSFGMHLLLISAQDPAGTTFFQNARKTYGLSSFRPGIVMASGDQATSQTYIVPQFFQTITLEALEATRTPWGRYWMAYMQLYGKTVWGVS